MQARGLIIVLGLSCGALSIALLTHDSLGPILPGMKNVSSWSQGAATFFVESISVSKIQDDYNGVASGRRARHTPAPKVKILIVPGHQPGAGGAVYHGFYEREIVVDIADDLAAYLERNGHYDVTVARGKTAWNPVLQAYFDMHTADIDAYRQSQALLMATHLADGSVELASGQVDHMTTPTAAALELYGINKWASEERYDITLHLHTNDAADRRGSRAGRYDGFAVYVPDYQFSNAKASRALGEALAARLSAYHATSTLPLESAGVVEDQSLIAVGANNSADTAALLIEYGYIYEPQFQDPSVLPVAERDYAYQTFLGLQDFLGDPEAPTYGVASLPYDWSAVTAHKGERGPGIYALQEALRYLGYYPASGDSFDDCPISGEAGPCTERAIGTYQRARGLEATGTLGPQTRAALATDLPAPGGVPLTLH